MRGNRSKNKGQKVSSSIDALIYPESEIISIEECKKHLQKFHLSDERIREMRNSLIGIVDGVINSYLDNF